jgi:hypothetical protein
MSFLIGEWTEQEGMPRFIAPCEAQARFSIGETLDVHADPARLVFFSAQEGGTTLAVHGAAWGGSPSEVGQAVPL